MIQVDIDTTEIKRLEDMLLMFNKRGVGFATKEGINNSIVKGRELAIERVRERFVLRNKFSVKSIIVKKNGLKLDNRGNGHSERFVYRQILDVEPISDFDDTSSEISTPLESKGPGSALQN